MEAKQKLRALNEEWTEAQSVQVLLEEESGNGDGRLVTNALSPPGGDGQNHRGRAADRPGDRAAHAGVGGHGQTHAAAGRGSSGHRRGNRARRTPPLANPRPL